MTVSAGGTSAPVSPGDEPLPWSADDFLRWLGVFIMGLALLIAGWWMAGGQGKTNHQVAPASLAVVGTILACGGHVIWVLKARRAVGERMQRVATAEWLSEDHASAAVAMVSEATASASAELVVAAPGSALFHRAGCPMARDREWPEASRIDQEAAGRRPCGVCAP